MHHVTWLFFFTCITLFDQVQTSPLAIQGAGSTLPNLLLQDAFFAYRFAESNVTLRYSGTTSERGLCRLMSYIDKCDPADTTEPLFVDFAITASPLPREYYAQYPDLQTYPVLATAVVPIYNLGAINNLTLSSSTLAKIFSGKILHWDDPAILQDNPDIASWQIPSGQSIIVVVRSDVAAVTSVWKKSLASFDPGFRGQIPVDQTANWPNVTTVKRPGLLGMNSYVMTTQYSIGYSVLGDANDSGLHIAQMRRGDIRVDASIDSIEKAVMELGVSFGNNGDDPAHLTADIHNTMGVFSWPICSYVYLVVRKVTLRQGATCQNMNALVKFWRWFLDSEAVRSLVRKHHHGSLPEVVRDTVLSHITQDMTCNGRVLDAMKEKIAIQGLCVQSVDSLFDKFSEMYNVVDDTVDVTYSTQSNANILTISNPLANKMFVAAPGSIAAGPSDVTFAFAGVGVALISSYNLILDWTTLAHILDGTITTWLDPAIVALNPMGFTDGTGKALQDENQSIVLLRGPGGSTDILQAVMKDFNPGFTGAAMKAAPAFDTDHILETAVVGTSYALGIASLAGSHASMIKIAQFRTPGGGTVTPSWESVQRCASRDVYGATSKTFALHRSSAVDCYPLCQAICLKVRKSQCSAMDADRTHTVAFVEWLLGNANIDAAMQQHDVAPLRMVPEASAANAAALDFITCNPKEKSGAGMVFTIIGVVVGVGVLVVILMGVCFWRSTAQLRALRKQFSNDNVAQECAAAIACFDLDAVAWLKTLKHPNKIQTSFIKILHLLTEVKPFIPDQLLTALTGTADEEGQGQGEDLNRLWRPSSFNGKGIDEHHAIDATGSRSNSQCTAVSRSGSSNPSPHHRAWRPYNSQSTSDSQSQLVIPEPNGSPLDRENWTKKRCVFLYVKFGLLGSLDDPGLLHQMAVITTAIVTCCKKHGATIDKVTFNEVALHWGLASRIAEAPLRATMAAMEMAEMSRTWRSGSWIRMGIGAGPCHIATLGAGGHRFFVIYGAEIALPIQFVAADVQSRCKCTILMSDAVHQEVQYMVKCFPRAWFHDVLLWEPVGACAKSAQSDEWMYELKKMGDQDKTKFSGQTLQPVFMMAHNGGHPALLKQVVDEIKMKYGDELSPQDNASLDNLLISLQPSQLHLYELGDG